MWENSTMACPNGFYPYFDNNSNALTPCFISLVGSISTSFFGIIGLIQLVKLILEQRVPPSFKYDSKLKSIPFKHLNNLLSVLLQCVFYGILLTISVSNKHNSPITKSLLLLNLIFNAGIAFPTQCLIFFKSSSSVASQIFYLMFQTMLLAFQVSQRLLFHNQKKFVVLEGTTAAVLEMLVLINTISMFIYNVCFFEPSSQLKEYYKEQNMYMHHHVLANITFTWMNPLITRTYKDKKIKDPKNLSLPPVDLDIRKITKKLTANWESQKWSGKNSLLWALLKTFGKTICLAFLFETTQDLLNVINPQFLRLFINYFETGTVQSTPPLNGAFIALTLFLSNILATILGNQFYIVIFEAGLGIRGSLAAMVYQKSLRLSTSAREGKSTGDIINFVSVDVLRLQRFFENSQSLIGAPLQIVTVLTSLYWLLGNAVLGGILTMAVMIPINAYLSKKVKGLYFIQMKYKDSRIKIFTELLNSIKSVKLYSWETPMLEKLSHARNDLELENMKKIGVFSNLIFFAWSCIPVMVTCITFAIYSMNNNKPLTPDLVFPSLTLFNILNDAIYTVPSTINSVIEAGVSLNRLKDFLLSEEIDSAAIEYASLPKDDGATVVEINNSTFYWKSRKELIENSENDEEASIGVTQVALKNINDFKVRKGSLTCVIGRVGSGKTTLLKAVLGQLPFSSASSESAEPKFSISADSISYCPQESWIMNTTVKENILFGHKFDETYYNLTLEACQLLPDLKILPDGDATMVGEKGISLSGGQKARLSLARAVYSRSDLYLLDDILSAVDAEVSSNIISKVLDSDNGLLKNKTVILTTNSISVLKHSQSIFALENGEIVDSGVYDEVMTSQKDSRIKKLIIDFEKNVGSGNSDNESIASETKAEIGEVKQNTKLKNAELNLEADEEMDYMRVNSRKASLATLNASTMHDMKKLDGKTGLQEETKAEGHVKPAVYFAYIKACGILGVFFFFAFMLISRVFELAESFWLKYWSEVNEKNGNNESFLKFVIIYAIIGIVSAAFNNLKSVIMLLYCSIRGSKKFHDDMAYSVIRSPMRYFETTPVGRIINRFSSDLDSVDSGLHFIFSFFFRSVLTYVITVILVGYSMPWFFVFNAFLIVIYFYYQSYYVTLSRELKRLTSVSYSPIMSLISETTNGHLVINAYDHSKRFNFFNFEYVQFNIDCVFNFRSTNRWLSVRLQIIGAFIVLATAFLALLTIGTSKQLSTGMVGLLMSYSLQVTNSLMWIVRMSVQIETNIVSVERILEYCRLAPEAPLVIEEKRVTPGWPLKGAIEFKNYTTKYRENLDPVLKGISVNVKPGEKVGIVGRTGAGKSTLVLALFRLIEATEGNILIDDVDISNIGLSDLRSNLAIIPQDAQAFEGTVKSNMDPFNKYSNDQLWRAIELAHLKPHIEKIAKSNKEASSDENSSSDESSELSISMSPAMLLETKISENGSNLSVGQRQLLCLARALLNPSKILVLDEATAAIDMETDKIIQETIKSEFSDRTILTIAHRIDTVLGSDRIIVLDKGEVIEFDSPDHLLSDKTSAFYGLAKKGGYLDDFKGSESSK